MQLGFFMILYLFLSFADPIETKTEININASYWRMGSNVTGWSGVQQPLFRQKDNILFQNTGLVAQLGADLSPSFLRYGGRAIFTPVEVLDISAYVMKNHYFPVFQTLVGYDSPDAKYGRNADIDGYKVDFDRQDGGGGWQAGAGLTLKAKIGSVITLLNGNVEYFDVQSTSPQGGWFWEPQKEVLMKAEGTTMVDGAFLLMNEWERGNSVIRVGSITTYRNSRDAQDTLLRSGAIGFVQVSPKVTHIILLQSYIIDRAFDTGHPFVAYSLSLTY